MKVLVTCKRVVDYNVAVQVKPDHSGVMLDGVKMSMNPFDEIALEQAIQLKEQGLVTEIVAVSLGSLEVEETLRQALAMGADRALLLHNDLNHPVLEPRLLARYFAEVIKKETPDLLIMGKQAIDQDYNQTGQMLASVLDWPQATFASAMEVESDKLRITREIDGGLDVVEVSLPAVVTTDLRLNQPRFIALPNIIRAKQKPMETVSLSSISVNSEPQVTVLKVEPPKQRSQGEVFTEFDDFFQALTKSGVLD